MSNEQLDQAVLNAIAAGKGTFHAIWMELPKATASWEDRALDRALQRLRKAGKVRYSGKPKRWLIGELKAPCSACRGMGWV